jgi:hypothetical protein
VATQKELELELRLERLRTASLHTLRAILSIWGTLATFRRALYDDLSAEKRQELEAEWKEISRDIDEAIAAFQLLKDDEPKS